MTPTSTPDIDDSLRFDSLAEDVQRLIDLADLAGCEVGWLRTFHARLETHAKLHGPSRASIDIETARLFDRLGKGLLDALYSNLRLLTADVETSSAAKTVLADEVRHVEQRLLKVREALNR